MDPENVGPQDEMADFHETHIPASTNSLIDGAIALHKEWIARTGGTNPSDLTTTYDTQCLAAIIIQCTTAICHQQFLLGGGEEGDDE